MIIGGISPTEKAKPGVRKFVNQAISNLEMAHDAIIESRVRQTHQENKKRRAETPFAVGSVAMVLTDVFQINWFSVRSKIGKIAEIFVKIEDPENRGVI
jgi:hypothetical protein